MIWQVIRENNVVREFNEYGKALAFAYNCVHTGYQIKNNQGLTLYVR